MFGDKGGSCSYDLYHYKKLTPPKLDKHYELYYLTYYSYEKAASH